MLKIDHVHKLIFLFFMVLWFYPFNLYAQSASKPNSNTEASNQSALPTSARHGASVAVEPSSKGLKGIAAYADWRDDLTPEQIKIGFAFARGNESEALVLIKQAHDSVDFAIWKDNPNTPLIYAAAKGNIEMVAAILGKGIPVDSTLSTSSSIGQTALISVLSFAFQTYPNATSPDRTLEMTRFLLKKGANPNAKNSSGQTPISSALRMNPHDLTGEKIRFEIVKELLEKGANPGTQLPLGDKNSVSDIEITKLFLEHGLDPKAKGSTSLAAAVHNRKLDQVTLLLKNGADPNMRALAANRTVLADAVVTGLIDVAKALIRSGANPNVCTDEDANGSCASYGIPLIFTAPLDPELFHMMMSKGANPNIVDAHGQTALGYAISYRTHQEQGIAMICIAGTTNCTKTPEDPYNRTTAVRMLLEAGVDPNKRSSGTLPLTMVEDDYHEVIALLLDKGANMESLTVEGERIGPISQAIVSRKDFLASELIRRTKGKLSADEKWAFYNAVSEGKQEMVAELVHHGIKPDERGPIGETALHYAAHTGKASMVKLLLTLGANPNTQTDEMPRAVPSSNNPFAFFESKMQRKQKVYKEVGLQPQGIGDGKVTPLMIAVTSGDIETVKTLLDAGAKVLDKSQRGLNSLDIAHEMGNLEIEKILVGHR